MGSFFPDYVQIDFNVFNSFSFNIPAIALQIDHPMIVQVVGEFGVSGEDSNMLVANVWAREPGGLTSGFISTVRVPAKKDESPEDQATRLFRALNADDQLLETLADYIQLLIRHK